MSESETTLPHQCDRCGKGFLTLDAFKGHKGAHASHDDPVNVWSYPSSSRFVLQAIGLAIVEEGTSPATTPGVQAHFNAFYADGVSHGTFYQGLGRLVEDGLVEKRPDPRDSRARLLSLTDTGEDALWEIADRATAALGVRPVGEAP